jgi:predicted ABC-type sugar transport system permease subunit
MIIWHEKSGEKSLSSIPWFAGVTAVFMLLMLFLLRRNSERK